MERDEIKRDLAISYGYKIMYIWENEYKYKNIQDILIDHNNIYVYAD